MRHHVSNSREPGNSLEEVPSLNARTNGPGEASERSISLKPQTFIRNNVNR